MDSNIIILWWLLLVLCVLVVVLGWADFAIVTGGRYRRKRLVSTEKDLNKSPRTKSEQMVVSIFEKITGQSFPTCNPEWLVWRGKTLELDGFCKALGLAIEFSGPLHTKWFPAKEQYTQYFDRLVKDVVKKRQCKKNGVHLIVVDQSLPTMHRRDYINSRLYDVEFLKEQPVPYIPAQQVEPFRNEELEAELGINCDMVAANNI